MLKSPGRLCSLVLISLVFTACGKKSGGGPSPTPPPGITNPAAPSAPGTPGASPTSGNPGDPSACGAALTGSFAVIGGIDVCPMSLIGRHTVILYDGDGVEMCGATRIGPNQLITAAHCLKGGVVNMQIGYIGAPQQQATGDDALDLVSPSGAGISGQTAAAIAATPGVDPNLKIIATMFHPRFDTVINGVPNDSQDIGMVVFSGNMPVGITPIANFADFPTTTAALQAAANKNLVKAGFGTKGDNDSTTDSDLQSVVLAVASLDSANAELSYAVGTKKGTCDGDSGGPGYVQAGTDLKLIGITSRGPTLKDAAGNATDSVCDNGNGIDTDARFYRAWISCVAQRVNQQFASAGTLAAPQLTVEASDTSAGFCTQTVIQAPTQLAAAKKTSCRAQSGMEYDSQNGSCTAVTASACRSIDGTWDSSSHTCAADE